MIMHLDLDAFFASAERIKYPDLHNKPVAVGGRSDPFIFDKQSKSRKLSLKNSGAFVPTLFYGSKEENFENFFKEDAKIRGIITTASYEARAYGIKTGMSIAESLRCCPRLIVCVPDHHFYHDISHRLKIYLESKVPILEQYSIDEFFADVSGYVEEKDMLFFAKQIQKEILEQFSLPISIGIAHSKWLAKLSTTFAKPDGIKLLKKDEIGSFIHNIPIEQFPGIGRAYQKKLLHYQKKTLGDIADAKTLLYSWGNGGKTLYDRVCGLEHEKVQHKRDRKSIAISRTFDPLTERIEIKRRVTILARHLIFLVAKLKLHPKTLYLGIRYQYQAKSKQQKTFDRLLSEDFFQKEVHILFDKLDIYPRSPVIRLTISLTNFHASPNKYPSLLHYHDDRKAYALQEQTQKMREKYGVDIIKRGSEL